MEIHVTGNLATYAMRGLGDIGARVDRGARGGGCVLSCLGPARFVGSVPVAL